MRDDRTHTALIDIIVMFMFIVPKMRILSSSFYVRGQRRLEYSHPRDTRECKNIYKMNSKVHGTIYFAFFKNTLQAFVRNYVHFFMHKDVR